MNRGKKAGFTLIEILIVMAIMAILATIALPSYQGTIRKSRRSEAIMTLLEIQLKEERYRANHSEYDDLQIDDNEYYSFEITDTTDKKYTITATAKTGTDQAKDANCSTLTLDQSGEKTPEDCWK